MRKPKVGEIVTYNTTKDEQRHNLGATQLPAIVVSVSDTGVPNLKVFTNSATQNLFKARVSVAKEPGTNGTYEPLEDTPVSVAAPKAAPKKKVVKKKVKPVGK